jgi:hypothetical protein
MINKTRCLYRPSAVLLLFSVLFVQACAIKTTNINADYSPDIKEQGYGIVVMSLSATGTSYLSLRARSKTNDNIVFPMFSEHGAPGVDWRNPSGRLMAVQLPVGRYNFYEFFKYDVKPKNGDIYSYSYTNRKPFSVSFIVEPGKTIYAGNLHIDLHSKKTVQVLNKQNRDIGLFLNRFKNFSEKDITVKLASID